MSSGKLRNVWVVVLFGAIAAFVGWRLLTTKDAKRAASSAPAPSQTAEETTAAPTPPPSPTLVAIPQPTVAAADPTPGEGAPSRPHVDIDTIIPASAWVDPPTPAPKPIGPSVRDIPATDPDIPRDHQVRSLAFYEKRVKLLEQQIRAAESRGDTQEIERLKPMLETAQKRVAILRAELGS